MPKQLRQPDAMPLPEFPNLRHWRMSFGSSGHGWLSFDKAESGTNTLSSEVLAEFDTVLGWLESRTDLPGLVIRSAKDSGFILGADVRQFEALDDAYVAASLAARGQKLLQRLEDLPYPTVALMDGYALGGGLELALACRYRVAVEGYERCIGLPEVQLGIHPGFGGTVRTVRMLGVPAALDMMLTGRALSPIEARRIGLVDRVVPRGDAAAEALRLLRRAPPPRSRAFTTAMRCSASSELKWRLPWMRKPVSWRESLATSRIVSAPYPISAPWLAVLRTAKKSPKATRRMTAPSTAIPSPSRQLSSKGPRL